MYSGSLGEKATGSGNVTVGGSGAQWTDSGSLTVGGSGQGTLEVQSGGKVSDTSGKLGEALNSQGTVNVDGGTWNNSGSLTVADSGSGTITITSKGYVTDTGGKIGENVGSNGLVTVQGTGSKTSTPTWYNNGSLKVGVKRHFVCKRKPIGRGDENSNDIPWSGPRKRGSDKLRFRPPSPPWLVSCV